MTSSDDETDFKPIIIIIILKFRSQSNPWLRAEAFQNPSAAPAAPPDASPGGGANLFPPPWVGGAPEGKPPPIADPLGGQEDI